MSECLNSLSTCPWLLYFVRSPFFVSFSERAGSCRSFLRIEGPRYQLDSTRLLCRFGICRWDVIDWCGDQTNPSPSTSEWFNQIGWQIEEEVKGWKRGFHCHRNVSKTRTHTRIPKDGDSFVTSLTPTHFSFELFNSFSNTAHLLSSSLHLCSTTVLTRTR